MWLYSYTRVLSAVNRRLFLFEAWSSGRARDCRVRVRRLFLSLQTANGCLALIESKVAGLNAVNKKTDELLFHQPLEPSGLIG